MNRKSLLIILICLALASIGFFIFKKITVEKPLPDDSLWENYEVQHKIINGEELRLVVADNPERWSKGLMFVRKPVTEFDGMIFIFPHEEYRTFWNMNTFENLTLYWMQNDQITSTSKLPSIEKSKEIVRVSSEKPVNIVVEVID